MEFELKDFLDAVGPSASLIFAAWIFLSFLQARYTAAYERYRSLIDAYRGGIEDDGRRGNLEDQIVIYRGRVEQMRRATNVGVIAAIFLITSLIAAGLDVMTGHLPLFKWLSSCAALLGLTMVAGAASYVLRENRSIQQAMDREPSDLPALAKDLKSAGVSDPR